MKKMIGNVKSHLKEKYFINENSTDDSLNETTHVSFHRRTVTQMAIVHKALLKANGYEITNHETRGDGSHIIHHINKYGRTRKTVISPVYNRKSYNAKIEDSPAKGDEAIRYGGLK